MNSRTERRDLDPTFLLEAYTAGFFPMADPTTAEIAWYSPDPRAILPLDGFRISRSLGRALRKGNFEIRINTRFSEVIRECADREETWISTEIISAYSALHDRGFAHSVETWDSGRLVGGLYGVALNGAFFGESMFSRNPNSSKLALAHLVERLRNRQFRLLDTQFLTSHLARSGAIEIERSDYLMILREAISAQTTFVD